MRELKNMEVTFDYLHSDTVEELTVGTEYSCCATKAGGEEVHIVTEKENIGMKF